jgi:hypothetical protein
VIVKDTRKCVWVDVCVGVFVCVGGGLCVGVFVCGGVYVWVGGCFGMCVFVEKGIETRTGTNREPSRIRNLILLQFTLN